MRKSSLFSSPKILHLPQDVLKQILLKLADPKDVVHFLKTTKALRPIYDDLSFWKQLCARHYPDLRLSKNDDPRAVFSTEYEGQRKLKAFAHQVDKMVTHLKEKLKTDNITEKLLHSDIDELDQKNKGILTKGETFTVYYFYTLQNISDVLQTKGESYKAQRNQLNELFTELQMGPGLESKNVKSTP